MGSFIRKTRKRSMKWTKSCPRESKISCAQWMLRLSASPKRVVSTYYLNQLISNAQWFHVEQELLLGRLAPVQTNYYLDYCCMKVTLQSLLNYITAWVANT